MALASLSFVVTGCAEDAPSTSSGTSTSYAAPTQSAPWLSPPPSSPPVPSTTSATYATKVASCPTGWQPLEISTDVAEEVRYIADVAACASPDGLQTYLENAGDGVWVPTTTRNGVVEPGRGYRSVLARARAASFQEAMADVYPDEMLTPGERLVVPVAPDELSWQLDARSTMAWLLHDAMANEVQSKLQSAATDVLSRRTPRGAAVAECTVNLYKVLERQPDLTGDDPGTRMLAAVSDTADGATCVREWRKADALVGRGQAPAERAVVTAEGLQGALRASPTEVLSTADTYLGRFASATKVIRLFH